jgi:hypothetical protein
LPGRLEVKVTVSERMCEPGCRAHPEHIYVLCFGRPTVVSDRDYLRSETTYGYPISHYVGYTRQQPPVRRIRSHGARSADHIVVIRPGSLEDEQQAKRNERCPRCVGSLWYYGGNPDANEHSGPSAT